MNVRPTFRSATLVVAATSLLSAITACGDDSTTPNAAAGASGGGTTSGGGGASSTAGKAGSAGTASTAGTSSGGGGTNSGGGGSSNGGGGNGSGGVVSGACPAINSLASDISTCNGYDTKSLSKDATYLQISSVALSMPVTSGMPLAISRKLTMGMAVVEYWGALADCGPAQQLLGTTREAGVECITTQPMGAYPYIISAIRDTSGFVSDLRVCDQKQCP